MEFDCSTTSLATTRFVNVNGKVNMNVLVVELRSSRVYAVP